MMEKVDLDHAAIKEMVDLIISISDHTTVVTSVSKTPSIDGSTTMEIEFIKTKED